MEDQEFGYSGKRSKYLTQAVLPQSAVGDGSLPNISGSDFMDEIESQQCNERTDARSRELQQIAISQHEYSQYEKKNQLNKVLFEPLQAARPSHAIKRSTHEMVEFDGESDQVLLGSAFDDTRTVQTAWNITQQTVTKEEPIPRSNRMGQDESQLSTVEEDEHGATQRVQEAWRRQKLLNDMMADEEEAQFELAQEDNQAEEYPVHGRFAVVNSSRREQQEINPPSLAQMAKESSMSFGFAGQAQQPPSQPQIQQQQEQCYIQTTEQSADFYVNSNVPTPMHSDLSRAEQMAYGQKQTHREQPSYLQQVPNQQSTIDVIETPDQRTHETRQFQQPTGKNLFYQFDQKQLDLYAQQMQAKEPQTEPRHQERQPPQFNQIQYEQRSLGNSVFPMTSMSPPQLHMPPQTHLKQPSHQAAEQFLTLDHFLNEQQSPPQYSEPKSHRLPSNATSLMMTEASSRPARQFQLNESEASKQSSLRQQQMEVPERHRVTNFDGRVGQRQLRGSPHMASTSPLRVDPEEIKRRQLLKQQNLEMKRRQEFEQIRKLAREKEMQRVRRLNSVVLIQKWVRGHLCRLEYARMRSNFRYIRKLRRLLSIAYGRKKSRFIKQLVFVLAETGKKHQKEFEEEIGAFCATLIQKVWRGFYFRRVVKRRLLRQYKSQRMLRALVQGYRLRCIMFRTRECVGLRREIVEILGQLRHWQHKLRTINPATTTKQQHVQIKKCIAQLKEDRRVKVSQLIRLINHLKGRGRWVHQLLPPQPRQRPQRKVRPAQYDPYKQQQQKQQPQMRQMTRYEMQTQPHQEPRGQLLQQLENDTLFTEAQPSFQEPINQRYFGDEIERENSFVFPNNGANQIRRPQQYFDDGSSAIGGIHDETAQNLIAHVGGQGLSPLAGNRGKKPQPFFDEQQALRQQEENNTTNDELAMMWPSQTTQAHHQAVEEPEDDAMAFMWPSQQKNKDVNKPENQLQRQPNRAVNNQRNKFAEIERADSNENIEDDSNAEVAIVWPSAATNGPPAVEEQPLRVQKQNSIAIQSKWADHQQPQSWDDQPVGGGGGGGPKPWDEMPVGGAGAGPKPWDEQPLGKGNMEQKPFDEQPVGGGSGGQKPWDEQPLGGNMGGYKPSAQEKDSFKEQKSLNNNDRSCEQENSVLSVQPPKIGLSEFELMIEKAMQEEGGGGGGGVIAQPGPPKAALVKKPKQNKVKKEGEEEEDPVKKKKKEAAAALLEKRKKYDPSKVLKKGKKGGAKKAAAKPVEVVEQIEQKPEEPEEYEQPASPEMKPKSKPKPFLKRNTNKISNQDHTEKEKEKEKEVIEEVKEPPKRNAKKIIIKSEPEEPNYATEDKPDKEADENDGKKPKPFLKRKTKTMQPAKINWKAKSKLDCWNADSKETKGTKREFASPPQKEPLLDEKTLIESQHELEMSMPKFSENQPTKLSLRQQPSAQPQQKILDEVKPLDDGDFELETVPNEQINCEEEKKVLPTPSQMVTNAAWKGQFQQLETIDNKDGMEQEVPRGGSFAQQPQKHKPQMSGRLPSHLKKAVPTEVDDFDQEPLPRQMVQQTRHNTNRAQQNARQPKITPPDGDVDTNNYNTFAQPEFAQPSTFPQLSMGQSMMQEHEHLQTTGPYIRDTDSYLNISEIQGQVSVMTHTDITSHGFGNFQIGADRNQMGEEGQSNLQLEELQKVFDLFHMVTETVDEVVAQTSLQRLQARELPKALGQGRIGQNRPQMRKVERKTMKNHTFQEVQIDEVSGQDTCVPHLMIDKSVFFQSYSSDQFEEIFEDLKGHYKRLCDEEPEGGIDDDSQNMSQF